MQQTKLLESENQLLKSETDQLRQVSLFHSGTLFNHANYVNILGGEDSRGKS